MNAINFLKTNYGKKTGDINRESMGELFMLGNATIDYLNKQVGVNK